MTAAADAGVPPPGGAVQQPEGPPSREQLVAKVVKLAYDLDELAEDPATDELLGPFVTRALEAAGAAICQALVLSRWVADGLTSDSDGDFRARVSRHNPAP